MAFAYCVAKLKLFASISATDAKPRNVVRHAVKIAHKVCENRKIYLKFLNKPNFNVPKNWGKIFGKNCVNISSRKILDTLEKPREKRCVKNCAEKPSLEKRPKIHISTKSR